MLSLPSAAVRPRTLLRTAEMRTATDPEKIRQFMKWLARAVRGPGRIYFTGGGTALLLGWRSTTPALDIKFDPEPAGVFEALPAIKDELEINIELAAPDDFIPPLPNWKERSPFIATHGRVDFFHYDLNAQALAKIERGHARDLMDVRQMISRKLVDDARLREFFEAIRPGLIRYPAIDPDAFAHKLEEFLKAQQPEVPK